MEKVIVIVGGSDGLGKALASFLVVNNKVVIVSPTKEKLKDVAKELNCDYEVADIKDYYETKEAFINIVSRYGKIDVLINSAGLWIQGAIEENDSKWIKEVIDVNFLGVVNATKAVVPAMKESGKGIIININSQGGLAGKAEREIYNASKWGGTGFSRSIEGELSKKNIKVVSVYPGKMNTDIFKKQGIEKSMDDALDIKEVAKIVNFVLDLPHEVFINEISVKNIHD